MLTRTLILSYRGADALNKSFNIDGGSETLLSEVVPAGANPEAITFTMDVSAIKLMYLVSDQDITLHTNDNAVPINTFQLNAGVPFVWSAGGAALRDTAGVAVATDITGLFGVNAGEVDANFEGRILFDPTP